MADRPALLSDYLAAARTRPLTPGTHDCALFIAGWINLCTGVDLAKGWRGKYRTLEDGYALLSAMGFSDLVGMAERYLGELDGWMQAVPGDVAVVEDVDGAGDSSGADHIGLGIIGGCHIHVVGLRGLDYVPLNRAVRVFRP